MEDNMTDNEKLVGNLKRINYDGVYSFDGLLKILNETRIDMEEFLQPT